MGAPVFQVAPDKTFFLGKKKRLSLPAMSGKVNIENKNMNGLNRKQRRVALQDGGDTPPVSVVECRFRGCKGWKAASAYLAAAAAYRQTGRPHAR